MAYPFTKPETGDEVQDAAQWAVILLPIGLFLLWIIREYI